MNNYEWIKARTIEEMALVLTNLEFKTYDEIRLNKKVKAPKINNTSDEIISLKTAILFSCLRESVPKYKSSKFSSFKSNFSI